MGTRTTQPWEDTYSNNPPIVAFSTMLDDRYTSQAIYTKYAFKGAWMLTRDGTGAIRTSPSKLATTYNEGTRAANNYDFVSGAMYADISVGAGNAGINGNELVGDEAGGTLFKGGYQYSLQYNHTEISMTMMTLLFILYIIYQYIIYIIFYKKMNYF